MSAEKREPARISQGYVPGALGRVVSLHAAYYQRHWGFGLHFESLVASEMAAFLRRVEDGATAGDPASADSALWLAWLPGVRGEEEIAGAITVDGAERDAAGARIRWFILDEARQGAGIGKALMAAAMDFCRVRGFPRVYLTTFAGLDAARALYEAHGFALTDTHRDTTWGVPVEEQRFEWTPQPK